MTSPKGVSKHRPCLRITKPVFMNLAILEAHKTRWLNPPKMLKQNKWTLCLVNQLIFCQLRRIRWKPDNIK
jgi:hypothetical protein